MTMRLEEKQALVAEVAEVAAKAHSAIAAEYRGMTVEQLTKLRVMARKQGVFMKVVKNTLARRAVAGTSFECMKDTLKGPLILAFSKEDPGAAARVMKDFTKDNEKLVVTAIAFGGKLSDTLKPVVWPAFTPPIFRSPPLVRPKALSK